MIKPNVCVTEYIKLYLILDILREKKAMLPLTLAACVCKFQCNLQQS